MDLRSELLKSIWYGFTALDLERSGKVSKSQLKVSGKPDNQDALLSIFLQHFSLENFTLHCFISYTSRGSQLSNMILKNILKNLITMFPSVHLLCNVCHISSAL